MRSSVFLVLGAMVLLATAGCSNVNVEANDESVPPHDQTFRKEMEGRSPDYRGPRVLELPEPGYPADPAAAGLEGIIMIRVFVSFEGKVLESEVQQGLHQTLDLAALEAARGGKYTPATEAGVATEGWLTVPFRYPPPPKEAE